MTQEIGHFAVSPRPAFAHIVCAQQPSSGLFFAVGCSSFRVRLKTLVMIFFLVLWRHLADRSVCSIMMKGREISALFAINQTPFHVIANGLYRHFERPARNLIYTTIFHVHREQKD
jgi:hypothetical protein